MAYPMAPSSRPPSTQSIPQAGNNNAAEIDGAPARAFSIPRRSLPPQARAGQTSPTPSYPNQQPYPSQQSQGVSTTPQWEVSPLAVLLQPSPAASRAPQRQSLPPQSPPQTHPQFVQDGSVASQQRTPSPSPQNSYQLQAILESNRATQPLPDSNPVQSFAQRSRLSPLATYSSADQIHPTGPTTVPNVVTQPADTPPPQYSYPSQAYSQPAPVAEQPIPIPAVQTQPRPQPPMQTYKQLSYETPPPRQVADPVFLPMPGPVYDLMDDGSTVYDGNATSLARTEVANINAGILGNHRFAQDRANDINFGTILRWDMITEPGIPQYNIPLQELGMTRTQFEGYCANLRHIYDEGRKQIDWTSTIILGLLCLPLALACMLCDQFPERKNEGDEKGMHAAIFSINQQLRGLSIPVAFSYKIHWQLRPVLHEVSVTHVPL